jgi:hypothetical protein
VVASIARRIQSRRRTSPTRATTHGGAGKPSEGHAAEDEAEHDQTGERDRPRGHELRQEAGEEDDHFGVAEVAQGAWR